MDMHILGQVVLGNPALWIGAFAIAVPVLVHILTRRTPRRLVFPTLKFIHAAKASQSSLFRIRHWLLLAVRTLLIMLILAAFLKPILSLTGALDKDNEKKGKVAIVLLDASASMGYAPGGASNFLKARYACGKIVDHLTSGQRGNLVLMASTPRCSFDEPGENLFVLRKDINEAKVSNERADVNAAIAEVVRQMALVGDVAKEIHFVSDFQRSNWSNVDFSVIPEDVRVLFVPVSEKPGSNVAVTEVAIQPAAPTVSEQVHIVTKVANYGAETRVLDVEMSLDSGKVIKEKISLSPDTAGSADFTFRPTAAGDYRCRVTIPADDLSVDDSRYFTFRVSEKIDVLIVSDEDPKGEFSSCRFLARAINPFLKAARSTAVARVIRSSELDRIKTLRSQVVILTGINELSKAHSRLLVDYMANGGSVVYFHVGGGSSYNLTLLAEVSNGDFVSPFKLTGQVSNAKDERFSVFANANFDHPILKKFKETAELGDFKFYRYFTTERVKQKGQVLLQYDDGNIAMASKGVGAGRILLCNFSCSLEHCDIARHTLFVPVVHEIVRYMRPDSAVCNSFEAGQQCSMTINGVSKKSEFEFKKPSGETTNGNIEVSQDEAAVFFPMSDQCGFYSVHIDKKLAGSVAVNVNSLESNLDTLSNDQLAGLSQVSRAQFYASMANTSSLDNMLEGRGLWHYFVLAAILLMAMEQILMVTLRK